MNLIETVVVMAIIGILAAVSIPGYLSTRNKALAIRTKATVAEINRGQLAYYHQHGQFADDIINDLGIIPNSRIYGYTTSSTDLKKNTQTLASSGRRFLPTYLGCAEFYVPLKEDEPPYVRATLNENTTQCQY